MTLPSLIVHADWSSHPAKRWMSEAYLDRSGKYVACAPRTVGPIGEFLPSLSRRVGEEGCALVGFDFPIGLPIRYASLCGIVDFLEWLPRAGKAEWSEFFLPAETSNQINLYRPFYPKRPGGACQMHLLQGLGVHSVDQLRRICELPHPGRRAAAPLFWTLGAQQVGKAAITGWREVLQPAICGSVVSDSVGYAIWPFSGQLSDLLSPGRVVLVETYPAEFYSPLGVNFSVCHLPKIDGPIHQRDGKRSQAARKRNVYKLLEQAEHTDIVCDPMLVAQLEEGFEASPSGEDAFDAVIGLLGMLQVILGKLPLFEPLDPHLRSVEGWIFGQGAVD